MKSDFIDKYGQFHIGPSPWGEPPSNDGMIMTAFAKKLGIDVTENTLAICEMLEKIPDVNNIPSMRSPLKATPYPSRDFHLGCVALGVMMYSHYKKNGWNFSPLGLPRFNLFKLIAQLWGLRGKHRNHFWKNTGFEQVYHTAFMVPFQDRSFYYEAAGKKAPWYYRMIAWVDKKKGTDDESSKYIHWLKYGKELSVIEWANRFGADHPFTAQARENSHVKRLAGNFSEDIQDQVRSLIRNNVIKANEYSQNGIIEKIHRREFNHLSESDQLRVLIQANTVRMKNEGRRLISESKAQLIWIGILMVSSIAYVYWGIPFLEESLLGMKR